MITIDGFPIDLAESEEHKLKSEVTQHPTESGSDISDNVRNLPRELTLTGCVVSDTPIGAIALDDTRILGDTLPPVSRDAYRKLELLWESRRSVVVVTDLKKYESMVLDDLSIPREAKNAGGLVFTAHFVEVRIINNKRVTVEVPNASKEANLGLNIDHLVEGKQILWRKGSPPGTAPFTIPVGKIVGQEVVTVHHRGKRPAEVLHADGKPLTVPESNAFVLDLNRDVAVMTNRGLFRAQQAIDNDTKVLDRADELLKYKTDHPGAKADPAMFGLTRNPDGTWKAK